MTRPLLGSLTAAWVFVKRMSKPASAIMLTDRKGFDTFATWKLEISSCT